MTSYQIDPRPAIKALERAIDGLSSKTMAVDAHVADVARRQDETQAEIMDLRALVEEFIRRDQLAKQIQLAETRIVQVRQELTDHYGHFGVVRRTAVGVIQALDTGIVRESTIQTAGEELMLSTPGYWLAPAIVTVASWIRNDKKLAEKALAECVERNDAKTALFFALLLRRYARWEASAAWMTFFFQRQDPLALPREFVIILEGVAYGAFGPAGKRMASETIEGWLESEKIGGSGASEAAQRWRSGILALTPPYGGGSYPLLTKHAGNWGDLKEQLRKTQVHGAFRDLLYAVFDGELVVPSKLEARIDSIIAGLVSEFDVEELPLRRKEAELQAIIEYEGDIAASSASAEERKRALDNRVAIGEILTSASLRPREAGASRAAQRLAVAMSKDWVVEAHGSITAEMRASQIREAEVAIEGWQGTLGEHQDLESSERSLRSHVKRETDRMVEEIKFGFPEVAGGIGSVLSLVFTFVGGFNPLFLMIALGLAGWVAYRYTTIGKRKEAMAEAGRQREEKAARALLGSDAELTDYLQELDRLDAEADVVSGVLVRLDKRQFELADAEGRSSL